LAHHPDSDKSDSHRHFETLPLSRSEPSVV
jgi:hypothetical protein